MAATEITLTKIPFNDGVLLPATSALTAEGALVQFDGQDTKTLILVENTAAAAGNITIKKGTGIQAVADLVVNIPASKTMAFVLESGAYKEKGKVNITGASTMKVAALYLP